MLTVLLYITTGYYIIMFAPYLKYVQLNNLRIVKLKLESLTVYWINCCLNSHSFASLTLFLYIMYSTLKRQKEANNLIVYQLLGL